MGVPRLAVLSQPSILPVFASPSFERTSTWPQTPVMLLLCRADAGQFLHFLASSPTLHYVTLTAQSSWLCNPRGAQVIEETVARLPAPKVVSFLTKVIAKLEAKPSRGQGLAKWIRAVLVQHTAHLMSVPGLVSKLSGLHQVCVMPLHAPACPFVFACPDPRCLLVLMCGRWGSG